MMKEQRNCDLQERVIEFAVRLLDAVEFDNGAPHRTCCFGILQHGQHIVVHVVSIRPGTAFASIVW